MCGIVGFKSEKYFPRLRALLPDACSSMSHRGPDDSGLFLDEPSGVGLGHRRLAVLDLSKAGQQPMGTEDGSVQIVYNGEVYNYREIRRTLEEYGHRFRSDTDSEVVLYAYLQWGADSLRNFVGMFSFAVWDGRKKWLFLARDRLGIKPLYYSIRGEVFLFASELKALMAFDVYERTVDPEAIPLFLHYQYVPGPKTIFEHTFKLLPGHYLIYDGRTVRTRAYWKHPSLGGDSDQKTVLGEQQALEDLDHLLTQAVSDRLISDVPLGALLSGGIDSSLVVALMQ
ncbi:MAG: asparagine synthase (glutamine-hydrolyzing), partial [bacterium]